MGYWSERHIELQEMYADEYKELADQALYQIDPYSLRSITTAGDPEASISERKE